MKLIIQIPCYNEERTLPLTLARLPRQVEGFDVVEWLVIDDGSTDKTVEVAEKLGVDHIERHSKNRGLARAFITGLAACLEAGADVIVNTDADNQYRAEYIPDLVKPILSKEAEIVIGARPIDDIKHFSVLKKFLQRLGSWVVRQVSGTSVEDAPSGFRAFSRDAAMQINVFSEYTYTLETIIQAGQKGMLILSVPVKTNPPERPSRLMRSTFSYVVRSLVTVVRIFAVYRPFKFFNIIGVILIILGACIGFRFLIYYLMGEGTGKIQSLILASILSIAGLQVVMTAFLADLLSVNRKLLEEMQHESRERQGRR